MNEFELIRLLTRDLPADASVIAGVGDDCAVLEVGLPNHYLLLKTDAVVEGIHFLSDTPPAQVGHKALARCLSDVAAMAGTPTHALVTLALPPHFQTDSVQSLYSGLRALAERFQVAIVGGETTTNPERVLLSVALLGRVEKQHCLRRSGAQPGDALWVTGELGGSIAGKHLEFEPRLAEAQWLAAHVPVHSMIDLSDGLAGDLLHLLETRELGAELHTTSIPVSRTAKARARQSSSARPPLAAALADGEDFELLFTTPSAAAVPLLDAWKLKFPDLRLTCIGKITAEPGVKLRDATGLRPLTEHGYVHFSQS